MLLSYFLGFFGKREMSNSESPISMKEHLSALLDDEAGSFEERRVIDELKSDPDLSKKLANYALIGETLRTSKSEQAALVLGNSFLDSIHEKLEQEDQFDQVLIGKIESNQVAQKTSLENKPSVLRPIGGFALAASVGALAFMGLQNIGLINNPATQPSNIVNSSAPTAIVDSAPVEQTIINAESDSNADQYVDADAQTRSMLKRYVDSHMQYATTSTFVPAVRTIAYTDNQ